MKTVQEYYKTNIRRKVKAFERRHKLDLKHDLIAVLLGVITALIVFNIFFKNDKPVKKTMHAPTIIKSVEAQTYGPIYEPTVTPTQTTTKVINTGNASYYSIDGCLGCNPGRIMANGEKLDDTRLTLAYNHLPMNTVVTVRNTKTGVSVRATVTDTGGFEKYNKIADLSVATRDALGCGSLCPIEIEL